MREISPHLVLSARDRQNNPLVRKERSKINENKP